MNFEEVFETLPANGWLTKPEAELLWRRARETEGPILEIGCYYGRSTVLLAALGRAVYCVDPFDNFDSDLSGWEVAKKFTENLETRNIRNVMLYQQKIENLTSLANVGFGYLDGDHTYEGTKSQLLAAINWDAQSICVHDYNDKGEGAEIIRAVEESRFYVVEQVERIVFCRLGDFNIALSPQ